MFGRTSARPSCQIENDAKTGRRPESPRPGYQKSLPALGRNPLIWKRACRVTPLNDKGRPDIRTPLCYISSPSGYGWRQLHTILPIWPARSMRAWGLRCVSSKAYSLSITGDILPASSSGQTFFSRKFFGRSWPWPDRFADAQVLPVIVRRRVISVAKFTLTRSAKESDRTRRPSSPRLRLRGN